jgi:hypothetical protein
LNASARPPFSRLWYDQYGREGYKKADELSPDLLDCDAARSYIAVQRRDGIPDED